MSQTDPQSPPSSSPQTAPGRPALPVNSRSASDVLAEMQAMRSRDARWRDGRTFSLVYHDTDEHLQLLRDAYSLFLAENALNPMAFPSLRKMETDVVAMCSGLLGGDQQVVGSMTSGGTESLFLAVKTYRDQARKERPQITAPEMVLPTTAHPALLKSAHYLGVKPVLVPPGPDFRADVAAMAQAITPQTLFLVGSAPAYPHGVIDPIEALSDLALSRGLPLHVDACVGGFLLPFVRKLGFAVPPFDFAVPGVTSMSADLHKYGFAAKGASTVMYRTSELRRHQFYVYSGWPGGLFGSATVLGTRPGGAIAAAWASLNALGESGYLRIARTIMDTTRAFIDGISAIPGLFVLGKPDCGVFAFASSGPDLMAIADQMEDRGWHMDRQQLPTAVHLTITPAHAPIVDRYLTDLRETTAYVVEHPELSSQGTAAMYGMLMHIPDASMVDDFILTNFDALYRP
ncbi:MAG TPA: aspartate aminotransferase family protein [Pseudomonadota bacterium]|nr:aspartate aminotransferase family protein [Pseudomonadota bacterium]HNK43695.1 aspartate aminotransferase family protein [Pseudomonadota bacterium]